MITEWLDGIDIAVGFDCQTTCVHCERAMAAVGSKEIKMSIIGPSTKLFAS